MVATIKSSLSFAVALLMFAFQSSSPTPDPNPLARMVSLNRSEMTSDAAISFLLSEAHTPGGIISIYDNCSQPNTQEISLQETTLKHGLDYVAAIDPQRKWALIHGVVYVGSDLTPKMPLNVVIQDFDINPKEPLSLTSQRMLGTLEVRKRIQELGLTELTPGLGFGQIRKTPVGLSAEAPAGQVKHLHKVVLADALNAVAAMHGTGVWEYQQFSCRSKSSYRLTWVAK